jgi:DNA mismatch repair protein MutS
MVEMVETAAILAQATPQSFVILDEVGRGTSTYDGLAIAWAVVEAIHEDNRCRCLFATHYHELTRLAERCDALTLHHVRAREWKGELVLLHELATGPADRSYGLAVARLAGMPPATVARAKAVLAKLEAGRAKTGGLAAGLDDLPLFAAAAQVEEETCDAIRAEVEAIDVDALTPREALRVSKSPAADLGLTDPAVDDETLLSAMIEHPILVNRPLVCAPKGVRLCRPSEAVLDLVDRLPPGPFNKEDGSPLIDAEGRRVG